MSLTAQGGDPAPALRGRVIDARTGAPLRDVNVTITLGRDTLGRARTDSVGLFQSAVGAAGTVVAHFSRIGYHPDSITAVTAAEFPLRVAMSSVSAANTLAAVIVRDTSRSSFERRARRGAGGSFIREEDIERRHPVRMSDLFRSLSGVRIDDSSGVTQLVSLRVGRQIPPTARKAAIGGETISMPSTNARPCVLRVGVNGRLMQPDFSVDDVRPGDVFGIEAYLGAATIPAEFSSVQNDAPCGIVMIWMKGAPDR
jgi:hypothetical protein